MRALAKSAWVETKLFLRDPLTVVFALAFPVMVVVVLGSVFGNVAESPHPGEVDPWLGVGPMDYYTPGYIGLAVAAIGLIAIPVRMAGYRERGVLRRFRASGVSVWAVLAAQGAVALGMAVAGALLLGGVAGLVYHVRVPASIAGVAAAFLACLLTFSAIGILLGALLPSARAAQGLGLILFFVMMFLAGTDGPRAVMGEGLRRVGDFLPLTHAVTALQYPWIGRGTSVAELLIVLSVAAAAALAAAWALRRD